MQNIALMALGASAVAASSTDYKTLLSKSSHYNRALVGNTDSTTRHLKKEKKPKEPKNPKLIETEGEAPPLPGVAQNGDKPKIILAQDINYPPFAYLGIPPEGDYELAGIVVDVVEGMNEICELDIVTVQTDWSNCWDAGSIGEGLSAGYFHGCMSYTHTAGERNRFLEFSKGILNVNKPAGLLVRLVDGVPEIDSNNDFDGVNVVDVTGWAPTADGLVFATNDCTGNKFEGWTMSGTPDTYTFDGTANDGTQEELTFDNPNDIALAMLLSRDVKADAVWIYADFAYEYQCDDPTIVSEWNCEMWSRFGTEFAYIHTGMFEHAIDGTTLSMSKKGSGLPELLNPCLDAFMQTEAYYDICVKYHFESDCYPNEFFGEVAENENPWALSTPDLVDAGFACADGYCSCDVSAPADDV